MASNKCVYLLIDGEYDQVQTTLGVFTSESQFKKAYKEAVATGKYNNLFKKELYLNLLYRR
jgi:hypothetical protein